MRRWAFECVQGLCCDVTSPGSVARLASVATGLLGGKIDVWINNAGYSGSFQVTDIFETAADCTLLFVKVCLTHVACLRSAEPPLTSVTHKQRMHGVVLAYAVGVAVNLRSAAAQSLLDMAPERIARVVQTNLLGSLLCTRAAARAMAAAGGGHIFNMDGAGADGQATPHYAAYGATKAGAYSLCRTWPPLLRLPSWCVLQRRSTPYIAPHPGGPSSYLGQCRKWDDCYWDLVAMYTLCLQASCT